jgi:hypothetical protein
MDVIIGSYAVSYQLRKSSLHESYINKIMNDIDILTKKKDIMQKSISLILHDGDYLYYTNHKSLYLIGVIQIKRNVL